MPPDFLKKTIDILAKRAAYVCSNPDCRVSTIGPNSDPNKSTTIGEAAHIFGARPSSKRFNKQMTDIARAEITNGIWLCRNCHKLIDTDENKYSSTLLFAWREQHEKHVQSELGNITDRINLEQNNEELLQFSNYPPLIRRIVIDKPIGWEYRLTAELMRYFNAPLFRKIDDLHDGLYIKPQTHIEDTEVIDWIQKTFKEYEKIINPIEELMKRLTQSWGDIGEKGDIDDIHHITLLIKGYIEQIILYEEHIYFVNVSDKFSNIINMMKVLMGSQAKKLSDIPNYLDDMMELIDTDHGGTTDNPLIINKTISFEFPDNWHTNFSRELKKIDRNINSGEDEINIWTSLFTIIIVVWVISYIF